MLYSSQDTRLQSGTIIFSPVAVDENEAADVCDNTDVLLPLSVWSREVLDSETDVASSLSAALARVDVLEDVSSTEALECASLASPGSDLPITCLACLLTLGLAVARWAELEPKCLPLAVLERMLPFTGR